MTDSNGGYVISFEQSIASQVISEIEGCKNTRHELSRIADVLDVTYEQIAAVKQAFEDGYDYASIKLVYYKYQAYESLNNDAPILAEFFRGFPHFLRVMQPQLERKSALHTEQASSKNSFNRITVSILGGIYNLTDDHQKIANLSTFLNLKYDYVQQLKSFSQNDGLDLALATRIVDKWAAQRLRSKKTPTITEFFIELEPITQKYRQAIELTKLGATKAHLAIFAGIESKDANQVRKTCGITSAIYDSADECEYEAIYNYIEYSYSNRTEQNLRENYQSILIELCHALDAGLPLYGAERQVKGNYNATFSHLLKLLEYNATYGSPIASSGEKTATGVLCEVIGELYQNRGLTFGEPGELIDNQNW
jgi:hypothetical protein